MRQERQGEPGQGGQPGDGYGPRAAVPGVGQVGGQEPERDGKLAEFGFPPLRRAGPGHSCESVAPRG
jgi:hypothetical protein